MKPWVLFWAFALSLVVIDVPAQACFEGCGWWTWGRRISAIDSTPLLSDADEVPQATEDSVIELQVAHNSVDQDPVVQPYGIRESEIRRAFDTAYHNVEFSSPQTKRSAYEQWKSNIGAADHFPKFKHSTFVYGNGEAHVTSNLDHSTRELTLNIKSIKRNEDEVDTEELRESGASLFARMFVALGGKQAVKSVRDRWLENSDNYATFAALTANRTPQLDAADKTFTGKMVERYYDMSASSYFYTSSNRMHTVIFTPGGRPIEE